MQFYFSGYTTDDDGLYTTGNGDVLAYYSFNAVPQNFNFLVLVAFMVGHSLAALYFMRQPTSQIKYVTIDNQEHNADSSSTSAASTDLSPTNNVPTQHSNQPEQMRTVSRVQIGESFSLSSRPSLLMTVSARLTNLSPMHSNSSVRGVGLQAFRANSTSVRLPRTRSVDSDLMKEIYDEPVLTVEYFRQHSSVTKPSSGCTLAFRDVHYHTDSNMHILNGVSGIVKPGEMCAMLGASGAGKCFYITLLHTTRTNFI